jgi:tetraacyldisaccharide 4'-kinase
VLSRGYGRRAKAPGATLVSDGAHIAAGVDAAGDEPLMLARAVEGLIVVVDSERYEAGVMAESQYGATVHVLDDGFQHMQLARDIDLLIVAEEDLRDRPLPSGRLREPIGAARVADALIVDTRDPAAARTIADRLGVSTVFEMRRALGQTQVPSGVPVFAVAGIGRPDRFFDDVRSAGLNVAGTMAFRDHHWYTASDVARIVAAATASGATTIVITSKDAVKLQPSAFHPLSCLALPLVATVEPADAFEPWLMQRLGAARARATR